MKSNSKVSQFAFMLFADAYIISIIHNFLNYPSIVWRLFQWKLDNIIWKSS